MRGFLLDGQHARQFIEHCSAICSNLFDANINKTSLPRRRFQGREEIRAPLKTPAWEATTKRVWCSNRVQQLVLYLPVKSCSLLQLVDVGNMGNFSQAPRNSKTEPCPSAASKDNRRFQRKEDFGAKHEQIYHFAEQPLSFVKKSIF